jgi:putative ABC transport system ATP-binding protein
MICVENLRFVYPNGDCALRVTDFTANAGESIGIAGPSGVGKTTFLRLLAGLLIPIEGKVSLQKKEHSSLSESARRKARLQGCGLVFQDFALLDYLTVEDNVLLPMRLAGTLGDETGKQARDLIASLDLGHHWCRLTSELSQGERQRVAVARALVHRPKIVLADEPTSSLDERRKHLVMDLLAGYAKQHDAALVIVSHDADLLQRANRIVNVEDWKA